MMPTLSELGISDSELKEVIDSALARVTPSYAQATLHDVHVTTHARPDGTTCPAILLRICTTSPLAARGQYLPLTGMHDAGYVDEYLFGVIHGHWLAVHNRDLFYEVRFIIDAIGSDACEPALYELVTVAAARDTGLLPDASPLARHVSYYGLKFVLRSGAMLSGPSPGMIEVVAEQTRRLAAPRFL
ncbi:MAG: hypothetical protein WB439_01140, partial [Acidobacteriaceae bacterium]